MPNQSCPDVANIFTRDSLDPSIAVADGYGLRVHVNRGHLIVCDGVGDQRRERRIPRIERIIRRLVIFGHTGSISLEAFRWCRDVGVAIVQIDSNGQVLLAAGSTGRDDPRLRRAQSLAAARPIGISITKTLLSQKLDGQHTVLSRLGEGVSAATLDGLSAELTDAETLAGCREIEAKAANSYFNATMNAFVPRFASIELSRVPAHWVVAGPRRSVLDYGRSPRKAATPINALRNLGYGLAEAECRLALLAVGLDPGLGILHADGKGRDSLALDIIEPIRPMVDLHILQLLERKHFRTSDFHETRDGTCRVLAPVTHELAEATRDWSRAAARLAEYVAHAVASDSASPIPQTTPLTGRNHKTSKPRRNGRRPAKQAPAAKAAPRTCRNCGTTLPDTARKLCPGCWKSTRARLATERGVKGAESRALMRAQGNDPTNTPAARAKRAQALSDNQAARKSWENSHQEDDYSLDFDADVLPSLAEVPLGTLQSVTGLSISAVSRIRAGKLVPHRRHWAALMSTTERAD